MIMHKVRLILHLLIFNACFPVFGEKRVQSGILEKKLESMKALIFNNAKATVTLDSTALKELLKLLTSTLTRKVSITPIREVSFSVYLKSKSLKLEAGQKVIYDGIVTNDGNGYDAKTGTFLCPVAGNYMFVMDSLSHLDSWINIKVNNVTTASAHHRSFMPSYDRPYVQTSRTVIVKLKRGDQVNVENAKSNGFMHGEMNSGFTGTLLY